jgi:uncharacterized membrane protein
MNSLILTKIIFFILFIWIGIYWFVAFSTRESFIYKFQRFWRYIYGLGLLLILVSSFNVFIGKSKFISSLNYFLIGGILTIIATAVQMNKKK